MSHGPQNDLEVTAGVPDTLPQSGPLASAYPQIANSTVTVTINVKGPLYYTAICYYMMILYYTVFAEDMGHWRGRGQSPQATKAQASSH